MHRPEVLCLFVTLAVLAVGAPATAQPYLLRDIHLGPPSFGGFFFSAVPVGVTPSRTVFAVNGLDFQVWATDGTAAGTERLPLALDTFDQHLLATLGGRLVFRQATPDFGGEPALWSTDGTVAGTTQLTFHDTQSAQTELVGILGDTLFVSLGGPAGRELWATDGTVAGTRMVRDLAPGHRSSRPSGGAEAGGVVLFSAWTEEAGRELWRTDGTANGTVQVADLGSGPGDSNPDRFVSLGARSLFVADDGVAGTELWISDGTAAETHRIVDLTPGSDGTGFFDVPVAHPEGGLVFFVAESGAGPQLWRTDGTAVGTVALSPPFQSYDDHHGLLFAGGRIVFSARTQSHGHEPWISDGTAAGTGAVDLCPGPCSSFPRELESSSRGVTFLAKDFGDGEVYVSDGTVTGTFAFADLCVEECDLYRLYGEVGGRLVLFTDEDEEQTLWASEGVPGDAVPLRRGHRFDDSIGAPLGTIAGWLAFAGSDAEHGVEIWRTDGTAGGTERTLDLLREPSGSSHPGLLLRAGSEPLFVATEPEHKPLWRTDGTVAGTERIAPLVGNPHAGWGHERYQDFEVAGDRLYLAGTPGNRFAVAVWITDGTPEGTATLLELPDEAVRLSAIGEDVLVLGPELWRTGPAPGSARRLAEIWCTSHAARAGGRWVFGATLIPGGESNRELWSTDGTAAGTRRVKDIHVGLESSDPGEPVSFRGRAWFAATGAEHGRELWSTDGTEAGTRMLVDLNPAASSSNPRPLVVLDGRLVFSGHGPSGRGLWATDGTAEGTIALGSSAPGFFIAPLVVGGVLYWLDEGMLWRSDGTPGGTRPAAGLLPSVLRLDSIGAVGDLLTVSVIGYLGDSELWLSDGTPEGTRRAVHGGDVGLTSLFGLGIVDDVLVFSGFDRVVGQEPWAVHLGDAPGPFAPPAAPSALAAEPVSPTAVRLSWRDHAPDEARFRVEVATPHGPRGGPLLHPADTSETVIGGLEAGVPVTFRVRAENALGPSEWSAEASATPEAIPPGPCAADDPTLCLLGGRFALRVTWRDQRSGDVGIGHAVPYPGSGRTGTFWFFDPTNVELIAKALDGRPVNGAFWSFFGGLSDVEYWVTVTDTVDRRSRTYHNPPGRICGVGDTAAFPEVGPAPAAGAAGPWLMAPGAATRPAAAPVPAPGTAGACQPGPETLCLLDGRLKVEVAWNDHHNGGSGPGRAVPGTGKTGYFWFFNQDNAELVVKALDGTPVNGHLWVFWGALTDVEYTITVTDTETGVPVDYHNPPGEICGGADTAAF